MGFIQVATSLAVAPIHLAVYSSQAVLQAGSQGTSQTVWQAGPQGGGSDSFSSLYHPGSSAGCLVRHAYFSSAAGLLLFRREFCVSAAVRILSASGSISSAALISHPPRAFCYLEGNFVCPRRLAFCPPQAASRPPRFFLIRRGPFVI